MEQGDFRAWMTAHGYSVRRLADELGVRPSTVQRYRDGTRPIPKVIEVALRGIEAGSR